MPNPLDNGSAYTSILLEGQRSPGIATVKGANTAFNYAIPASFGITGAATVFSNVIPCEFSVEIDLFSKQDFADWDKWIVKFEVPPRGAQPKARDIYHPNLKARRIKSVLLMKIHEPEQSEENVGKAKLDFKQWLAPVFSASQVKGSKSENQQKTDPETFALNVASIQSTIAKANADAAGANLLSKLGGG